MLEAIILAGGLGTRLRSTVPDLPKPMAPINGRPFLEHQMDYWIQQGVTRFVLSVGFMRDKIMAHFQNEYRGVEVAYAEEIEPLGTGGGLVLAYQKLIGDQPFLVMNGDTFFEVDLKALQNFHHDKHASVSMALFQVEANDRYMGVQVSSDGYIQKFRAEQGVSQLANGGVYLMNREVLKDTPWQTGAKLSLEDDLFQRIQQSGHYIGGMLFEGRFIDIGVPFDYQRAASVLAERTIQ